MKSSGIGGMAVIEGIMMRNKDEYAIAVRKPNKKIVVEKKSSKLISDKYKIFKLPIIRGVGAFIDSMVTGIKVLNFSASFYEEESNKKQKKNTAKKGNDAVTMFFTIFLSLILAIAIFMVLPFGISMLLTKYIEKKIWLSVIEGIIRLLIFIIYVVAISRLEDIKRVFMYHGAEHKAINCIENGFDLTAENVRWQSKEHKRCGTSFMLYVMFISIIFFLFINVDQIWLRMIVRILLVPVIAGVSYEFIRFAGNSDSKIINILSKPGLMMQRLTTKEPDKKMIEVAIMAIEAVFDWKEYLAKAKQVQTSEIKETNESLENENKDQEDDDILDALDKYLHFDE